jgi:hypothetical protein
MLDDEMRAAIVAALRQLSDAAGTIEAEESTGRNQHSRR